MSGAHRNVQIAPWKLLRIRGCDLQPLADVDGEARVLRPRASLCLSHTRQPLSPCPVLSAPPPGKVTNTCFLGVTRCPAAIQGRLGRLPHQVGRTLEVLTEAGLWTATAALLTSRALGSATAVTSANEAEAWATESDRSRELGIVSEEERKRKKRHTEGP